MTKCKSIVISNEEANLRKHSSQVFNNLVKDYSDAIATLCTMANRLAEIDEKPTSALINSDTKVVLKLQNGLSLADFANSLKMRDMPLNTKLKELTNSLFPANQALKAHDHAKKKTS